MFETMSQTLKMSLMTAMVVTVCIVDSVTIAYDGSLMGSVNVMPSYSSYFSLTTSTKAVNSTATYLGAILMAPFGGYIVDRRGRKEGIVVSAILNIIGAAISGSAQNIAMFISGRMIIGLGMGLAQTAASSYVSETTAPRVRPFALGMYFSCWALGSFLAAGVCYGVSADSPSLRISLSTRRLPKSTPTGHGEFPPSSKASRLSASLPSSHSCPSPRVGSSTTTAKKRLSKFSLALTGAAAMILVSSCSFARSSTRSNTRRARERGSASARLSATLPTGNAPFWPFLSHL